MKNERFAAIVLTIFACACAEPNPTAPTSLAGSGLAASGLSAGSPSGSGPASGPGQVATVSPYGGDAVPLIEVAGSSPAGGGGILNDPQTGKPGFNNFEVTVNVHGGPPRTDVFLQFLADVFPDTRGDGVCPGEFPAPPAMTIGALHTSGGGAASAHIKFQVPEGFFSGTFDSGEHADFKWRVVNLEETFDLQTPCVTLTGK